MGKSYTLPIFNLMSPHSRNFHLSWMGFFVAFLSWFAFPPLIPEAIRSDLKLTTAQVGNSNIVALCATLIVRWVMGPAVDRFGPRKCMAAMLIIGAIPSGLAGTVKNAGGLYTVRFFIGILGGTFVPCQVWTTTFFDKNVVGTANALVGGWGNMGGGVTFVVQIALFNRLLKDGLSSHSAWRAAFAIVPVPILFIVAALTLIFGTDCPAGQWSARHTLPATALGAKLGHVPDLDESERQVLEAKMREKEAGVTTGVEPVDDAVVEAPIDVAVSEHLTVATAIKMAKIPYTWLPALMYLTTFGFELAVDANLANVLYAAHKSGTFGQTKAGYYASIFGFLNFVTRPAGGYLGDLIYRRFGVKGKKFLAISLGFMQGVFALAFGLWQRHKYDMKLIPGLGTQIGLVVGMAIFCEAANGANFSLVPHCNSYNNGFMSGLVGGCGNLGGIFYALIFRYQTTKAYAAAWWISGLVAMIVNFCCVFIPAPPK